MLFYSSSHRENRLDCVLALALALAVAVTPLVSFGQQCQQLRREVFRLHILADSDSPEDQRVKLAVRDAVLEDTQEIFGAALTLAEAEAMAAQNLDRIEEAARQELLRQGRPPVVKAEISNCYFSTRVYDAAILPAGRYDALRLTIGSGSGQNWWCVMFPPLCVESAAKEKTPLAEKTQALDDRPDYKLAFASVELVENLVEKFLPKAEETAVESPSAP